MYAHNNNVTYLYSSGVEHTPKEIKTFINSKNMKRSIFRIQAYDPIMCGYFCIGYIEYTNLFSPDNFKENDDIILDYFMSNI